LLKNTNLLYNNKEEILLKMKQVRNQDSPNKNYASIVSKFSPEKVMKKFEEVFLV